MAGLIAVHPNWLRPAAWAGTITYPTAEELRGDRPRPVVRYAGLPLPALLTELRKSRDLKMIELDTAMAEELGTRTFSIGNYESGRRTPMLPILIAFANVLDLDREERVALIQAAGYRIGP